MSPQGHLTQLQGGGVGGGRRGRGGALGGRGWGSLLAGHLSLGLLHQLAEHGLHLCLEVIDEGLDPLLHVLGQGADLVLHGGGQGGEVVLDLGYDGLDLGLTVLEEGPGERGWGTNGGGGGAISRQPSDLKVPPNRPLPTFLCRVAGGPGK